MLKKKDIVVKVMLADGTTYDYEDFIHGACRPIDLSDPFNYKVVEGIIADMAVAERQVSRNKQYKRSSDRKKELLSDIDLAKSKIQGATQ